MMIVEYDVNELQKLVDSKDVQKIKTYMKEHNLTINGSMIESLDKKYFENEQNIYDIRQYCQKICLNSLYGLLLQSNSTFYDFRLGASTTMSGRKVWQHLSSAANEKICGVYEPTGECLRGGDTDSCYMYLNNDAFKRFNPDFDYSRDNMVKFADSVADHINDTYPDYMEKTFHCQGKAKDIMKCGREVVASRGLFVSKKRYALMVFDKDGFRMDTHGEGKLKIMGLQVQRSDTPMIVRKLLKKMIESLLTTGNVDDLYKILKDFKKTQWQELKPWQKGTPKAVNKLTYYTNEYNKTGKCSVGHVMGSINWNNLIKMNNDQKSPQIKDGDKVIVCKLKDGNIFNMKSVAYPIDLNILPKWFKELPFDEQKMSGSVVDKTIESIFGVLGLDLSLDSIQEDMDEELAEFIQTY